ncbi:hypothetical protein G6F43_009772 [Rhizopus delemar]|nr:hypothetical protein G6F43_009772 [Rhizopus delemar]
MILGSITPCCRLPAALAHPLQVLTCGVQEAGETLTKYLKKLYRQHTIEQHFTTICPHDSADPVEDIDQLLPIARQFYQPLHFTDPVDDRAVNPYLDNF